MRLRNLPLQSDTITRCRLQHRKVILVVAVPLGVTTWIGPVAAPEGTIAVICVLASTLKLAGTPAKVTEVAPWRFVPVIITRAPVSPRAVVALKCAGSKRLTLKAPKQSEGAVL
jgi:hypothetical protein